MNYDEAAANSKRHYIGAIARLSAMGREDKRFSQGRGKTGG